VKFWKLSRAQLLVARVSRNRHRRLVRSMLLDASELDLGLWSLADDRTWRAGTIGERTDEARRARSAGCFTALRSFRRDGPSRGLWIQITSFASSTDAESVIPKMRSGLSASVTSKVAVQDERDVTDVEVRAFSQAVVVEKTVVRGGVTGFNRYIIGSVGAVVCALGCSGAGSTWSLDDVVQFAVLQGEKVQRVLAEA